MLALRDEYQEIWRDTIAAGVATGDFTVPDTNLAAMAMLQMCTGVAHWYSPDGRMTLDQLSAAFVAMALAPARRPAGTAHGPRQPRPYADARLPGAAGPPAPGQAAVAR